MQRTLLCCFLLCATANDLCGQTTLRVPADYASIQAAIDSTQPGDCVLVAPGHYLERIRLRPKITVRSAGGDGTGKLGLARAEVTILDGGGDNGPEPGVAMAEGSTLDGFTVTRVGSYDEALWQHHHDTHGEELGDDEGAVQAEGTTPAISIREVGMHCHQQYSSPQRRRGNLSAGFGRRQTDSAHRPQHSPVATSGEGLESPATLKQLSLAIAAMRISAPESDAAMQAR
jgi:hypothetical protein